MNSGDLLLVSHWCGLPSHCCCVVDRVPSALSLWLCPPHRSDCRCLHHSALTVAVCTRERSESALPESLRLLDNSRVQPTPTTPGDGGQVVTVSALHAAAVCSAAAAGYGASPFMSTVLAHFDDAHCPHSATVRYRPDSTVVPTPTVSTTF